jgi:hypothetical protein
MRIHNTDLNTANILSVPTPHTTIRVHCKSFPPEYPPTVSYPKLYDASSIDQAKGAIQKRPFALIYILKSS